MPKAPRRCAKPPCRKMQPCPDHPKGWANNTSPTLPKNWKSLVRAVRARDRVCVRCGSAEKTEVDHIVNRARGGTNDLANLQLLCRACHALKTWWESRRRF